MKIPKNVGFPKGGGGTVTKQTKKEARKNGAFFASDFKKPKK